TSATGTIAPGSTQTMNVTAKVGAESEFACGSSTWTNTAKASASNASSVTDTAKVVVTRVCNPSNTTLTIEKTARNLTSGQNSFVDSAAAFPGDIVQFQILVKNTGNAQALNVNVSDTMPAHFTLTTGTVNSALGTIE